MFGFSYLVIALLIINISLIILSGVVFLHAKEIKKLKKKSKIRRNNSKTVSNTDKNLR